MTAFSLAACSDDDSGDSSGGDSEETSSEPPADLSTVILGEEDAPEGYAYEGDTFESLAEEFDEMDPESEEELDELRETMGVLDWNPEECGELVNGQIEALIDDPNLFEGAVSSAYIIEDRGDLGDSVEDPMMLSSMGSYSVALFPGNKALEIPDADTCREATGSMETEGISMEMKMSVEDWDMEGVEVDGADDVIATKSTLTLSVDDSGGGMPMEQYGAYGTVNGVDVSVVSQGEADPAVVADLFAKQVEQLS
ncbi:MAG TPA: hypothetical protein H9870_14340 [Candidatus Corynebacterium avicola]|uniref:Uncharacterized protein n=1 Tax=Candidatus Corynebacterium avicola TaxID=2838527 RepID=A0A9D1RSC3_9CORY|nr:hypothetical protein [Candidatus Corynebacterium avicola]